MGPRNLGAACVQARQGRPLHSTFLRVFLNNTSSFRAHTQGWQPRQRVRLIFEPTTSRQQSLGSAAYGQKPTTRLIPRKETPFCPLDIRSDPSVAPHLKPTVPSSSGRSALCRPLWPRWPAGYRSLFRGLETWAVPWGPGHPSRGGILCAGKDMEPLNVMGGPRAGKVCANWETKTEEPSRSEKCPVSGGSSGCFSSMMVTA